MYREILTRRVEGDQAIKNDVNRMATKLTKIGVSKPGISKVVASMVHERGPIGTGKYACTCNNWGPRWIENSADGCCPGCFAWAMDKHYEVPTSKLDPNRVTRKMIVENTWGINVRQLDLNRARKIEDKALDLHERCHKAAQSIGNWTTPLTGSNF